MSCVARGFPAVYKPASRFGLVRKFHNCCGALCQRSPMKEASDNVPQMPLCDFSPKEYEGLPYDHAMGVRKANQAAFQLTFYKKPLLIQQGYMQWVWDSEKRRYLDLFAGIVTISVGHCHPKVTVAAQKQVAQLCHTTSIYLNSRTYEYIEKLTAKFPDPLKVVFFVNSGSEANDLAMFLARLHTQCFDIITLRGAYHGASPYTMGLTSNSSWKFAVANGFGCHPTMCPDVFSGPWGGSHCRDSPVQTVRSCSCSPGTCQAKDQYIEQLKDVFQTCVPKRIAGFIAEPIQGVNGVVQYPKGFLKEAFQLIRERGGVCIADEVQTGFGRVGSHYWGFQSHDIMPDIVTMAKGIGNGFPMGAVVTTPEIAKNITQALHFNTFGGNPVACAVGSAVLDAIEEDGLQKNCDELGTYFMLELAKLQKKYDIIGDVRGKGLMIGLQMVKDRVTRKPLPVEEINQISEDCKDMGVLLGTGGLFSQTFRIKPPMCIRKEDVDFAVAVFETALEKHMRRTNAGKQ